MLFRIQKLLMCEYSDFEETVLVESPFAQVTESGKGIRQVQIALTPTKLVIAVDYFDPNATHNLSNVFYMKQDPETECMELVTLIPLDFLYIKIFRKGQRQLMKVVSVGGFKVMFFEFGGHLFKNLYWNVWRDRISALRTNQNRYFGKVQPPTSSSSEHAPQSIEVQADIHRNPNEQNNRIPNLQQLPESARLISSPRRHEVYHGKQAIKGSMKSKESEGLTSPLSEKHNCALREIAQYFLDTQSEIIVRSTDKDACDGSCINSQFRSASLGNIYSCMGAGW